MGFVIQNGCFVNYMNFKLWRICSEQKLWRQRNSRCLVMASTHAAEERVTYAVTSQNSRIAAFSVVHAMRVAMQQCGKHISAAVNLHAVIDEAIFSAGPPRGYIKRISSS
jgi:hypothetical protein